MRWPKRIHTSIDDPLQPTEVPLLRPLYKQQLPCSVSCFDMDSLSLSCRAETAAPFPLSPRALHGTQCRVVLESEWAGGSKLHRGPMREAINDLNNVHLQTLSSPNHPLLPPQIGPCSHFQSHLTHTAMFLHIAGLLLMTLFSCSGKLLLALKDSA